MIAVLLWVGCAEESPPQLAFRVARPTLDLGVIGWNVEAPPTDELSILNLSEQSLLVTPLGFEGDGAEALAWWEFSDYTEVFPADTVALTVTLTVDALTWVSDTWTPTLAVEVGTAWNDPTDFDLELTWIEERLQIPVTYELDCDLDDDGLDAPACGGPDCDEDPLIESCP